MEVGETVRSSLRVDRFRAQYLVASDHPAPAGVKSRLDETLRKTLPSALSSLFVLLVFRLRPEHLVHPQAGD